ncbi:MAG: sulfotransferase [Gammaproteobacteria bacterium]
MNRPSAPRDGAVAQAFDTALRLHREGQLQRAEFLYRDVLRQAPDHAEALNMLGVIGCQTGNFAAGADLIRRALAIAPGNADFHNNLGMALLQRGEAGAAVAEFEQAVKARPRFAEALFNLGNACLANDRRAEAEKHYRKALKARPDYTDALNNLGNSLRERGEAREAAQLFHRLVSLMPGFAPGHLNLGLALQAQGRLDEALAAFGRATDIDGGLAMAWACRGDCHRQRGEPAAAEEAYRRALDIGGATVPLLNALGMAQFAGGCVADARACFERARDLDGDVAVSHDNLGMTLAAAGDRDQAAACFERAVALEPALGSAWRNLAELTRDGGAARALAARIADARDALPADANVARGQMEFARGRLLDLCGEEEAAFAAWSAANALRRRAVRFDAVAQQRFIDELLAVFDADFFAAPGAQREDSELPVFVVGMPRSGTTLVEQILAAHHAVHGAGELTFFPELPASLPRTWGSRQGFPRCVAGQAGRLAELAPRYLELLRSRGGDAARVVDKMPYNFLYLGLIAAVFRRARVIHCRRDPVATCFSIHTHELAGKHPYAHDQADLVAAYAGYARLMAHWRQCLPLPMLEVDYEDVVGDLEGQARRLVEFLGLDWDPACLAFHRVERTVTTASQWQVREPIYTTGRDHWQRYTQHLGVLRAGLAGLGGTNPGPDSVP